MAGDMVVNNNNDLTALFTTNIVKLQACPLLPSTLVVIISCLGNELCTVACCMQNPVCHLVS